MPEIGDEFRAARQARHLSLSEVSEQLHIRSVYLEAIENQEWSLIGAAVYVRGFIRTYARFLGLDPEAAVAFFNAAAAGANVVAERPGRTYSRSRPRRGPSVWVWTAGLAAAILVGFVGYNFFQLRALHGRPVQAPSLVFHRAIATTAERPAVAARRTLEVRLTATTWLSVTVDGARRLEGTFPPGTRRAFHGKLADIRTGNAGGVELTVNGKDLGAMGHSGGVLERSIALTEE